MVIAIGVGTAITAANAVAGLLGGLGAGSQTLIKLRIQPLPPSQLTFWQGNSELEVQFNPKDYAIVKPVTWTDTAPAQRTLNAPPMQFGGGGKRTLTLNLMFDVTEPVTRYGQTSKIVDVRQITNDFVKLTRIERDANPSQPPVCAISWGMPLDHPDFPFVGVVTSLTQTFTLFRSDGTPVRADLKVDFTEWLDREEDLRRTDPEETTRMVKRGDTLGSIAFEVYGNPALWRIIAEANQLDDPRHLDIGKLLTIPKLR
jgi:nucleoid-associated protein YgaU